MADGDPRRSVTAGRRQVLRAGASAAALGFASWTIGARAAFAAGLLHADVFPSPRPIDGAYPFDDRYPEQSHDRYSAASGKIGVAFSGGGARAFAAALGQMRGLKKAGQLDRVGAISCVSGGSWFGSLFSFVHDLPDDLLLGAYVEPAGITAASVKELPAKYLGKTLNRIGLENIIDSFIQQFANAYDGLITYDRIYSRVLNDILLRPYDIDDTSTYFTFDETARARIKNLNTDQIELYVPRPGRPYFIASATQIYQPIRQATVATEAGLPDQMLRHFEYTSLYTGTPQFYGPGADGRVFGGGYVESFAFDTAAPAVAPPINRISVTSAPAGNLPFLLSDVIGSSSAFLGQYIFDDIPDIKKAILDIAYYLLSTKEYDRLKAFFAHTYQMAAFSYWPILQHQSATEYAFGDGGILENTGIVPLLRRGYSKIYAFVNTPYPIGYTKEGTVDGIDGQVSQLFGFTPTTLSQDAPRGALAASNQNIQVFSSDQFQPLAQELAATMAQGASPIVTGRYTVLPTNPFDIPSYTPEITWFYNSPNAAWLKQLQPEVAAILASTASDNDFTGFPNFSTYAQNMIKFPVIGDVPNPSHLSASQINLLVHLWAWTVRNHFA